MSKEPPIDEFELSDAELVQLLKNHGIDRRSMMKVLGVGTALSLGVGNTTAKHENPHPPVIDPYYGYAAPEDEALPKRLQPDHHVELHVDPTAFPQTITPDLPFHFEPMGLHVSEGAIVRFDFHSAEHTITAYHEDMERQQRVPDDKPPFSSPVINGEGFWLYEFDSPGTYDLFCAPHEFFGMVMRVVVGDPNDDDYDGEFGAVSGTPPQPRPPISPPDLAGLGITTFPFPTAAEVFATDALTVSNIVTNGPEIDHASVEADL